ncbi:Hypothetical predicted protein [Cloeon dipterum]|uniref:Uncharacterized protein n=1 Tax=Cloeon dipterum TaxID=197152 RepID=A0A8S1CTD1_9INSE|nr:Hypothetical predicted protein [Cloeon dipterum]
MIMPQVLLSVSLLVLAISEAAVINELDDFDDANVEISEERQKREIKCDPVTDEGCTTKKPFVKENPKKRKSKVKKGGSKLNPTDKKQQLKIGGGISGTGKAALKGGVGTGGTGSFEAQSGGGVEGGGTGRQSRGGGVEVGGTGSKLA